MPCIIFREGKRRKSGRARRNIEIQSRSSLARRSKSSITQPGCYQQFCLILFRYYNFTFSSDEEEETKQTTTKQSDSSIPEFDFNDEFEPPEDGVEEKIEKKDLHRLVFNKDLDEITQQ